MTFALSTPEMIRKLPFGPDGKPPVRLTEKYRPATLADVVGQGAVVQSLQGFLNAPYSRGFILAGDTGLGKTTCARALANDLNVNPDWDLHEIKSATCDGEAIERGLSALRQCGVAGGWKMLLIDEADTMSDKARKVLLSAMEDLPTRSIVVLTTNHPERFEARFLDRFEPLLTFASDCGLLLQDAQTLADRVWQGETGEPQAPDVRTMPNLCQAGAMSFRRVVNACSDLLRQRAMPTKSHPLPSLPEPDATALSGFSEPIATSSEPIATSTVEAPARTKRKYTRKPVDPSSPAESIIMDAIGRCQDQLPHFRSQTANLAYHYLTDTDKEHVNKYFTATKVRIPRTSGGTYDRFSQFIVACCEGSPVKFPYRETTAPEAAPSIPEPSPVRSATLLTPNVQDTPNPISGAPTVESDQSNPADSVSGTPEPSEAFQRCDRCQSPAIAEVRTRFGAEKFCEACTSAVQADGLTATPPPSDFPEGSHKAASDPVSTATVDPSSDHSGDAPRGEQVPSSPIHDAYRAWQHADDAWSAELVRQFGKDAGDKRYLPHGKGEPGSLLRQLHDAWNDARMRWEALAMPALLTLEPSPEPSQNFPTFDEWNATQPPEEPNIFTECGAEMKRFVAAHPEWTDVYEGRDDEDESHDAFRSAWREWLAGRERGPATKALMAQVEASATSPDPYPVFPPVPGFLAIRTPPARVSRVHPPAVTLDEARAIVKATHEAFHAPAYRELETCCRDAFDRLTGVQRKALRQLSRIELSPFNRSASALLRFEWLVSGYGCEHRQTNWWLDNVRKHIEWAIEDTRSAYPGQGSPSRKVFDHEGASRRRQIIAYMDHLDVGPCPYRGIDPFGRFNHFITECVEGVPIHFPIPPIPPEERERLEQVASSTL